MTHQAGPSSESTPGSDAVGLLWGVGAVALRLGIATATLRTWERRYGLGPSKRTDGGHRRYSEEDIGRVQLMGRLVTSGVPAQSAAEVVQSLDGEALAGALAAPHGAINPIGVASSPSQAINSIVTAAVELDADTLTAVFSAVLRDWGAAEAWMHVLVPALRMIGEQWAEGRIGIESEHLASERLATELHGLIRGRTSVESGRPMVLLAGAQDEPHALPLLALEATLATRDLEVRSLGSKLPRTSLRSMIERFKPPVVFLWASLDQEGLDLGPEPVGERVVRMLLGGPGWNGARIELPDNVFAERVYDLPSTVDRLIELTAVPG